MFIITKAELHKEYNETNTKSDITKSCVEK